MSETIRSEQVIKRSVTIAGHRTSFSLEEAFWLEVKRLAKEQGLSLNQFIEKVDEARTGNLSSTLRIMVLRDLQNQLRSKPSLTP
ncbi:ribbon-helix-helix domain-containing protein [Kiloniella antarctica]|uniref:Ribbon-helix-helix domain-containing protein n=1 Tax=Kiloniella antarctica TaxID=1550907 RepID=A0ABW5BF71_9PROT